MGRREAAYRSFSSDDFSSENYNLFSHAQTAGSWEALKIGGSSDVVKHV